MKRPIVVLCLTLACAAPVSAAHLRELAWLAGTWTGKLGDGRMEEIWTEPDQASMVGTFRAFKGTQAHFYEFMTVERSGQNLMLRLRHFNAALDAEEDQKGALKFESSSIGAHRAVFVNKATKPPETLTYTRVGNRLVVRLDAVHGGKPESTTFFFQRR